MNDLQICRGCYPNLPLLDGKDTNYYCRKCKLEDVYQGLGICREPKYPIITFLDVNIDDYSSDTVTDNYALIQIKESMRPLLEDLCLCFGGINSPYDDNIIPNTKYILATNNSPDVPRASRYLQKQFAPSSTETAPFLLCIDSIYGSWSFKLTTPKETKLDISMESIIDIVDFLVRSEFKHHNLKK